MNSFAAVYTGLLRRRWLARVHVTTIDRARQAEVDRQVAEARLAATFTHRRRPSRLDLHVFDPVARQFDPVPKRRH